MLAWVGSVMGGQAEYEAALSEAPIGGTPECPKVLARPMVVATTPDTGSEGRGPPLACGG